MSERIKAKYGELEFEMVGVFGEIPPTGWYIWPEDLDPLQALVEGALHGPFDSEGDAAESAAVNYYEKARPQ